MCGNWEWSLGCDPPLVPELLQHPASIQIIASFTQLFLFVINDHTSPVVRGDVHVSIVVGIFWKSCYCHGIMRRHTCAVGELKETEKASMCILGLVLGDRWWMFRFEAGRVAFCFTLSEYIVDDIEMGRLY